LNRPNFVFVDADLLSEGKSSDPQVVPAVSDGKNNTNIKRVKKYKRQILSPTSCSPSDAECKCSAIIAIYRRSHVNERLARWVREGLMP